MAGLGLRRIGHTVEVEDTPSVRGMINKVITCDASRARVMSDDMRLNTLSRAPGSRKTPSVLGRGIGSGVGKTAGRGHKGQKSRSGGTVQARFRGWTDASCRSVCPSMALLLAWPYNRRQVRSELNRGDG